MGLLVGMLAPQLPRQYPYQYLDSWGDCDWLRVPVVWVPTAGLVPTQEGLSIAALANLVNGGMSESDDYAGRAVVWNGVSYLHDGHHRWIIAVLRGELLFPVRLVTGKVEWKTSK